MAKKKTSGQGSMEAGAPASSPRKAAAPRGAAVSPLTGGAATTSEEAQLAVANDSPATAPSRLSYDEIAQAAYQRYLSRGGTHGRDFDDWIEAERELLQQRSR